MVVPPQLARANDSATIRLRTQTALTIFRLMIFPCFAFVTSHWFVATPAWSCAASANLLQSRHEHKTRTPELAPSSPCCGGLSGHCHLLSGISRLSSRLSVSAERTRISRRFLGKLRIETVLVFFAKIGCCHFDGDFSFGLILFLSPNLIQV